MRREKLVLVEDIAERAHETLALATETRKALSAYQAAERIVELRKTIVEAARLSADLARRQHDAGNIDDYSLTQQEAARRRGRTDADGVGVV